LFSLVLRRFQPIHITNECKSTRRGSATVCTPFFAKYSSIRHSRSPRDQIYHSYEIRTKRDSASRHDFSRPDLSRPNLSCNNLTKNKIHKKIFHRPVDVQPATHVGQTCATVCTWLFLTFLVRFIIHMSAKSEFFHSFSAVFTPFTVEQGCKSTRRPRATVCTSLFSISSSIHVLWTYFRFSARIVTTVCFSTRSLPFSHHLLDKHVQINQTRPRNSLHTFVFNCQLNLHIKSPSGPIFWSSSYSICLQKVSFSTRSLPFSRHSPFSRAANQPDDLAQRFAPLCFQLPARFTSSGPIAGSQHAS